MSDKPYEVKAYSHQISDTGDYDGHWEITNGKVTLFTKDDPDDEVLQKVADALNESGCEFYLDDSDAFLRHHFEKENKELNLILPALEQTIIDQDKVILEQRKEIETHVYKFKFLTGLIERYRAHEGQTSCGNHVYNEVMEHLAKTKKL